jgi:hypothetical protein
VSISRSTDLYLEILIKLDQSQSGDQSDNSSHVVTQLSFAQLRAIQLPIYIGTLSLLLSACLRISGLPKACSDRCQNLVNWCEFYQRSLLSVKWQSIFPRLPEGGEKNILITSALPYCNNVPHLGMKRRYFESLPLTVRFLFGRQYHWKHPQCGCLQPVSIIISAVFPTINNPISYSRKGEHLAF